MSFLLCFILGLLVVLSPIFLKAESFFSLDKKTAFCDLFLFGLRVTRIRLLFAKEGVFYSINKKNGVPIKLTDKPSNMPVSIFTIRLLSFYADVNIGGDISISTYASYALIQIIDIIFSFFRKENLLDRGKVRVIPCYLNDQTTVKISIRFFTSVALFISGMIHTKQEVKNGKRSYREDHG